MTPDRRPEQPDISTLSKRESTIRAALALKGFVLLRGEGGAWVITRWNLCREVTNLDDLESFARHVGAPL